MSQTRTYCHSILIRISDRNRNFSFKAQKYALPTKLMKLLLQFRKVELKNDFMNMYQLIAFHCRQRLTLC